MRSLLRCLSCLALLAPLVACDTDESTFEPGEPEPAPQPTVMPEAEPQPEPEPEGPHGIDSFDSACADVDWMPGACEAGMGERFDSRGAGHIDEAEPITYDLSPPVADNHRGTWARWGEYASLPPQRWLHNLEHGGITLLYHPCAPAEMVDALREIAQARGDDYRWILTPYADLPSAVAVVAWEWRYQAECVDADAINAFFDQRYRMAPEDVASDGRYAEGWLGR